MSVVCLDKTGTLTEGGMEVAAVPWTAVAVVAPAGALLEVAWRRVAAALPG
ncbi:hypothetical protein AB0939_08295 [Streptomyces sp. NPDC006990]|uniref:hypothetical protein n=1 Tax=unclassified Streptomyces TaxID=2593676 RepID=UPI0034567011